MVFLVRGRRVENVWKRKKTHKKKSIEKWRERKQRIQEKSNNSNKHFWFNYVFFENIVYKNFLIPSHFIYSFCALQDIWNVVMILQSSYGFALMFRSYDIWPEIYINRLGATTLIFITMSYLILMLKKYLHFRKKQKYVKKKFFPIP